MKAKTYRFAAYILASFLGLSFYYTIYKLFSVSPTLGLAIVSGLVLISVFLIREADFVSTEVGE